MNLQYHVLVMSLTGGLMYALYKAFEQLTKRHFSATWHFTVLKCIALFFFIPFGKIHVLLAKNVFPQMNSIIKTGIVPVNTTDFSKNSLTVVGIYIVTGIWILGIVMILLRQFLCYVRFRYIIFCNNTPADIRHQWVAKHCAKKLGINKPVRLYVNEYINTPMLIGFFTPLILLPTNDLEVTNTEYIILHELTHYKNKDLVWKYAIILLRSIHWFNPLVHLLSRDIEKWCEYTCDEKNAIDLTMENKKKYGLAILDTAAIMPIYGSNFGAPFLLPNQNLKERLMFMLNVRKMSKKSFLFAIIVSVILVSCGYVSAAVGEIGSGQISQGNKLIVSETMKVDSVKVDALNSVSSMDKRSELKNRKNFN